MKKWELYDILYFSKYAKHALYPIEECRMNYEKIERWVSMNEIADYLGVTRDTVLAWTEKRGMPGVKIGRTWKFKVSEVDAWMRRENESRSEK